MKARTPLIISGPADEGPEVYVRMNRSCRTWSARPKKDGPG